MGSFKTAGPVVLVLLALGMMARGSTLAAEWTYPLVTAAFLLYLYFLYRALRTSTMVAVRLLWVALLGVPLLSLTPMIYQQTAKALGMQIAGMAAVLFLYAIDWATIRAQTIPEDFVVFCFTLVQQVLGSHLRDSEFFVRLIGRKSLSRDRRQDKQSPEGNSMKSSGTNRLPTAWDRLARMWAVIWRYLAYDLLLSFLKAFDYQQLTAAPVAIRTLHHMTFAYVLYLHFTIAYELVQLVVSVVAPEHAMELPQIFCNPWASTSPRELWGRRWHQMFRVFFMRLAYRPTKQLLGGWQTPTASGAAPPSSAVMPFLRSALPTLAVFLLSGMVHEYMCWAALGRAGGSQLAFFMLQGCAVVAQGCIEACWPAVISLPTVIQRLMMVSFIMCTIHLFMEPWVEAGWHHHFWHPVPVLSRVASTQMKAIAEAM